jgi:hypothetical protein
VQPVFALSGQGLAVHVYADHWEKDVTGDIAPHALPTHCAAEEPIIKVRKVVADHPRTSRLLGHEASRLVLNDALGVQDRSLQSLDCLCVELLELETIGQGNADASSLAGETQFIISDRNVFKRLTEFFEEEQFGGRGGVGSAERTHRLARLQLFV